jgi:hypothetical protein
MSDKKIWLYSSISQELIKSDGIEEYKEKLNELQDVAAEVSNEGVLVTFLIPKGSKYRTYEKAIQNLSLLKKIYNERVFIADPQSAFENKEIDELLFQINKKIDKRKKINKQKRNKKKEKK